MKRRNRLTSTIRLVCAAIVFLSIAGILGPPVVTIYRIAGNSMRPSFDDGDRVLVTNYPLLTGGVDIGDTVIAESGGETLIKRVIGVPGDVLRFEHGMCLRNGEVEWSWPPKGFGDDFTRDRLVLGENEYFLAGDNRRISIDSRSFGPLPESAIVGKVIYHFAGQRDESGAGASSTALGK